MLSTVNYLLQICFALETTSVDCSITNDDLHHNADYTPYEGMKVNCWPSIVLSRGKIIVQDGQLQGEKGFGKFLKSEISNYVY